MRVRQFLLLAGLMLATAGHPAAAPAATPAAPLRASGQVCAPALPPEERTRCLAVAEAATTSALAAARSRALEAVAAWDGNLDADARKEWARDLGDTLDLWLSLRQKLCSATLIGRERRLAAPATEIAASECRLSLGAVILTDLRHRFGGEGGNARASFTGLGRGASRRDVIAAEGTQPLCRHPGRGGDYQPLTACYERHVARLDRELAAVHDASLAAIASRSGLSPAERAEWRSEAVALQELWRGLRDKACPLEAFETPNRFANSIYSGIVGPCLVVETEARIRWLRQHYRLR